MQLNGFKGMCVNHLKWVYPKTWTPMYGDAVAFDESVTALRLPFWLPDFEHKQMEGFMAR